MLLNIPNGYRLIDDGARTAVHEVRLDDDGAVQWFNPEPVTLSIGNPSGLAAVSLGTLAMGVSTLCVFTAPLKLIDGKLYDMAGGDHAKPARVPRVAIAA